MRKSVFRIAAALAFSTALVTTATAQNSSVTAGSFPTATTANIDVKTGDTTTSAFRVFSSANTELLRVTATGRLGIGTTAPAVKLHVIGDAHIVGGTNLGGILTDTSTTNPTLTLRVGDTNGYYPALRFAAEDNATIGTVFGWKGTAMIMSSATGYGIGLRANGSATVDQLYITPGGNVGIGTVSPSAFFHVNGTSSQYMVVQRGTKRMYINANWAGNDLYSQIANLNTDSMGLSLSSKDTAPEYLYISTGGNVGMGTVSPDSTKRLHVVGDARFDGTVTGTYIQAHYQDVAEWVPSRHDLTPGTVVVLDPQLGNGVAASLGAYDTAVAGVVSVQPGIILGEASATKEMVATTGRVKVKVDARRAPIAVGDLLVTSDERGVAMKSEPMDINGRKFHQPGTIIGKALEPLAGGQGEILVLLSMQ